METRRRELTPELFEQLESGSQDSERVAGPSIGFWRDSWNRLKKNRAAFVGLIIILVLVALAAIAPLLSQYGPYDQDLTRRFESPSSKFWFGTDEFGRDMWARVWDGTRVSLYIAFLAALLDMLLGVTYGAISASFGGRTDGVMQRVIEILNGIPYLVILVLVMLVLPAGILTITIALAISFWTVMARIVRGRVLQLREQEFALASRSLGASRSRLITKHFIPNSLGPILVNLTFTIPTAIFFEAFLSFVGLGIQVPRASLGSLIADGYTQLRYYPYLTFVPAVVMSLLMISFNLLGDGLRDALDPKMRK
jgi:oligopeptide transport system permease protein